jgi:hypothetical protein
MIDQILSRQQMLANALAESASARPTEKTAAANHAEEPETVGYTTEAAALALNALIELRNKAFAHSDAEARLSGHGKMTEVRLFFDFSHVTSFSSRPVFESVLLPRIQALSDLLANRVKERYDTFYEKVVVSAIARRFGPDDVGKEFELNVENEKGPMVLKAADLIHRKYPVVRPLSE